MGEKGDCMLRKLRLTVEGTVFHATLANNPLAESISAMCPFILKYVKRDTEYFAILPKDAITAGCKSVMDAHKNGLYYFEEWNALCLLFRESHTAPYEVYHVGDFEEDIATALEDAGNHLHITCDLEEGI